MSAPTTITHRLADTHLTTDEVAAALGYSQTATVIRLIREESLPAVRLNRRYYISETGLRDWMAERGLIAEESTPPTGRAAGRDVPVSTQWVAAQLAKFDADDLRRAGELLLVLSRSGESKGGAA